MKLILLLTHLLQFISAFKALNKKFEVMADYQSNKAQVNETVYYELTKDDIIYNNKLTIRKIFPDKRNNFTNFTVRLLDAENIDDVKLLEYGLRKTNPLTPPLDYKMLLVYLKINDKLINSLSNKNQKLNVALLFTYFGGNIFETNELNLEGLLSNRSNSKKMDIDISGENLDKDINANFEVFLNNMGVLKEKNLEMLDKIKEFGYFHKKGYKVLRFNNHSFEESNEGIFGETEEKEKVYKMAFQAKISKYGENKIKLKFVDDRETLNNKYLFKIQVENILRHQPLSLRQENVIDFSFVKKIKQKINAEYYSSIILILILLTLLVTTMLVWSNCCCKFYSYSYKLSFKY